MAVNFDIECTNAGYQPHHGHWVLRGIHLTAAPRERIAVLGPNGAGKTSLLHMLVGIKPIHEGQIRVGGVDVSQDSHIASIRQSVGLIFQEPDDQLFCATVYEDVAFGPRQMGLSETVVDARVRSTLDAVGMADQACSVSHHLSSGQKRRASLATVLVMQPKILLLDEPTNDLDPRGRRMLERILLDCPQTLLIATHDLEFVLRVCQRAILLDQGRLITDGPASQILSDARLMDEHGLEVPGSLRERHWPVSSGE